MSVSVRVSCSCVIAHSYVNQEILYVWQQITLVNVEMNDHCHREVPKTMSTQHPDNVNIPFFSNSSLMGGEDEVLEAYYAYSHLNCREQMWDCEGKEVDNFVVKKLLSRYECQRRFNFPQVCRNIFPQFYFNFSMSSPLTGGTLPVFWRSFIR